MDTIQISLRDGKVLDEPKGATAADVAKQISPRLAREAYVARVDGELADLSRPLDHDAKLEILTDKTPIR